MFCVAAARRGATSAAAPHTGTCPARPRHERSRARNIVSRVGIAPRVKSTRSPVRSSIGLSITDLKIGKRNDDVKLTENVSIFFECADVTLIRQSIIDL